MSELLTVVVLFLPGIIALATLNSSVLLWVGVAAFVPVLMNAIQRHILTLVRIPLERTVVEPEPVWEGGSTEVKLSKDMIKLIESGKPQYTPEKKGKSKVGFGSNFSPIFRTDEELRREEMFKKKSPLKFGEASIQRLPLHQLRAARASVGVIKILVRDVINGSAKKRLLEVYEAPKQSNLQGWVQAVPPDPLACEVAP